MLKNVHLPFPKSHSFYSFHCRFLCKRCVNGIQVKTPDESTDCTSHLSQWYHCSNNKGLPDTILSQAWSSSKCISFVFHHRSQGGETSNKTSTVEDEDEDYATEDEQYSD